MPHDALCFVIFLPTWIKLTSLSEGFNDAVTEEAFSHLAPDPHAHMNVFVYVPTFTADTWLPAITKSLVAARGGEYV